MGWIDKLMRSIAQKISRRLLKPLTYLIRRDSSFSKPYLYLLRLFIRKFRGRSIVVFRMLSCNEEDVLFELHQECQVGSYSPQKSGEADRSSCALLDCPAVKVYSLKNQVIHLQRQPKPYAYHALLEYPQSNDLFSY